MSGHWASSYVGLPQLDHGRTRLGCDCWGLARIIYQEELGISLPEYLGYASVDEHAEIASLIDGAKALPMWVPVTGPAVAFDLALFRRGLMLHMAEADCAKIERYDSGPWQYRLTGIWRHVDVIGRAA